MQLVPAGARSPILPQLIPLRMHVVVACRQPYLLCVLHRHSDRLLSSAKPPCLPEQPGLAGSSRRLWSQQGPTATPAHTHTYAQPHTMLSHAGWRVYISASVCYQPSKLVDAFNVSGNVCVLGCVLAHRFSVLRLASSTLHSHAS